MRYFQLEDDMSVYMQRRWHIGELFLSDGTEPFLTSGIPFDESQLLSATVTHMGHTLQFCHTSFAVPIATGTLAHAIQSVARADVQCIPVQIGGQSGMVAINVIRMVKCVDASRSEFDLWTERDGRPDKIGKYHYISRLILARKEIPHDAHFFRIKDWDVAIILSETVKKAMESVGCYGAQFTEVETS